MNGDSAPETIEKLRELLGELAKQASDDDDDKVDKPFFDTMCKVFGADSVEKLLEEHFDTEGYNDEWDNIVKDEERSEREDGVRCRVVVAFLSMWKKAIMRASSTQTDVERIWGDEFATMNTGYDSLTHMKIKLGTGG